MREIKFRVWDNRIYQTMHPADDVAIRLNDGKMLFFDTDIGGLGASGFIDTSWSRDFILMQYTELKDKNGNEIYEGDIVKCRGSHSTNNFVVEKDDDENGCGGFKPFVDSWGSGGGVVQYYQVRNCEIIGNIHENPELIKHEK